MSALKRSRYNIYFWWEGTDRWIIMNTLHGTGALVPWLAVRYLLDERIPGRRINKKAQEHIVELRRLGMVYDPAQDELSYV